MAQAIPYLMMAATAVQTIGTLRSASAQEQSYKYSADMALQARDASRAQAAEAEAAHRRKVSQFVGYQRAGLAQSGGGMGGSASDIMEQSARNAEMDALTMRYESDLKARGFEAEAQQMNMAASNAKEQGYYGAAGSILSGAGNYMGYKGEQAYRQQWMKANGPTKSSYGLGGGGA